MYISKVKIQNFKCFKDSFPLELANWLNIIEGNNEAGKSTILEAIHLALSGLYAGRDLKNELMVFEILYKKYLIIRRSSLSG